MTLIRSCIENSEYDLFCYPGRALVALENYLSYEIHYAKFIILWFFPYRVRGDSIFGRAAR